MWLWGGIRIIAQRGCSRMISLTMEVWVHKIGLSPSFLFKGLNQTSIMSSYVHVCYVYWFCLYFYDFLNWISKQFSVVFILNLLAGKIIMSLDFMINWFEINIFLVSMFSLEWLSTSSILYPFVHVCFDLIWFVVFNATFSNISAISWWLAAASRVHLFCKLQSRARTHAVLVIGFMSC